MFITILLSHIYFKVFRIQSKNDKFNLHYYFIIFPSLYKNQQIFFFTQIPILKQLKLV